MFLLTGELELVAIADIDSGASWCSGVSSDSSGLNFKLTSMLFNLSEPY